MNTEAPRCGLRLNGRNAAHASPSASASARTVSFSCSVSASMAKYPHETIASVAARPSMLSSRLNAFVMPTSHSSPIAHARMSFPTISTFRPLASTTTAAVICAASFARGLRRRRSSTRPATKTIVTPARIPPSSPDHSTAPLASASAIAGDEPREDADAAERRRRLLVPALVRRDGDEARAEGRAEEEPENRGGDRERGDRDDRNHNRERVVERPVTLDSCRCPFTPT